MRLARLGIENLRAFSRVELSPAPHFNQLVGDNGAGKTSVLEAIHLLSTGRSFRSGARDALIRRGESSFRVFAQVSDEAHQRDARLGLERGAKSWAARLDGEPVTSLSQLFAQLAVLCFDPASHQLIGGAAEHRRRFVDWALFHVEPHFLPVWRRHARALKQRNALLKAGGASRQLDAWDHELAESGEALTTHRERYLADLAPRAVQTGARLSAELPLQGLAFQPGWRRQEVSLADALLLGRERDRMMGYTGVGPHRADWSVALTGLPGREALSRGQTKLTALALLLAQAADYATRQGHWPVIALDDLPSELDRDHQRRALDFLLAQPNLQLFVTATEIPAALKEQGFDYRLFHVEQGHIASA